MKTEHRQRTWSRLIRILRGDHRPLTHRATAFRPLLETLEARILLDDNALGPNGIDSLVTGLTGVGVGLGQVEGDRPGLPGWDKAALSNPAVNPDGVYLNDQPAVINQNIAGGQPPGHAEVVAGIMIANGTGANEKGVAPNAALFSSAVDHRKTPWDLQGATSVAIQHILGLSTFDFFNPIRAFNESWSTNVGTMDGNNELTQFMDWSARVYDVLYVVAGGETKQVNILNQMTTQNFSGSPQDQYNGVVIAATTTGSSGTLTENLFHRIADFNYFGKPNVGRRHQIDLVAPGAGLHTPKLGGILSTSATGTSSVTFLI